jgi:aerobic C4-dicarboxylate transport protein
MSECRALTNLVGNGVATLVIARWDNDLDREVLARELERGPRPSLIEAVEAAPAD